MSLCTYCREIGHTAFKCLRKPRKPLRAKRRMKSIGAVGVKWIETRKLWLKLHKANEYHCHYCGRTLTPQELTLDHYKSRSRYPSLRYDLSNLVPCCAPCNEAKGSMDGDEYLKKIQAAKADASVTDLVTTDVKGSTGLSNPPEKEQ